MLAGAAVVYAVGEEAPTEGAGDTYLSPASQDAAGERARANASQSESNKRDTGNPPRVYQPAALFPDRVADAGKAIKETGETFSRVETQQVSFHDAVAFDPLTAYVLDPGFTLPTPAPPPEPLVQVAGALSEGELREVLSQAGWPTELHDQALRVIWCESRNNPEAAGDRGSSVGLFQMQWSGSSWRGWFIAAGEDEALRFDPVVNARTALYAYNRSGWAPWSCKP